MTSGELANWEEALFAKCEDVIAHGLGTFVQVGNALLEIRDVRLYRQTHGTFEDYCSARWALSSRHVNRMIEAARTVEEMGPIGPTITNEAQARAIAPVLKAEGPERAAEVLRIAAESGQLSAKAIDAAAQPAKVTTTSRTTETTKVEQTVDLATGELLPGPGLPDPVAESQPISAEQWAAENPIEAFLAADPDVRAANLRHDLAKWIVAIQKAHLFDADEIAAIAPDKAEVLARVIGSLGAWHDNYCAALRRSRMSVVKGDAS